MTLELHALACHRDASGTLICRCAPLILATANGAKWDNGIAGVSGESDNLSRDPAGLLTPGRRDLRVHGSKP